MSKPKTKKPKDNSHRRQTQKLDKFTGDRPSQEQTDKFFRSRPWDRWWDEFLGACDDKGKLLYTVAHQFSDAKGKDDFEKEVIWRAIGPEPDVPEELEAEELWKGRLQVKWLGDWQKRRATGFFFAKEKQKSLEKIFTERSGALAAAMEVGKITAVNLARFQGALEQVEEFFAGRIVDPTLSMEQNDKRLDFYHRHAERMWNLSSKAIKLYLQCNGLHNDDVTQWAAMLGMVATTQASAAIEGSASQPGLNTGQQALLMMQTFMDKSRTLKIPFKDPALQEISSGKVIEATPVKNGKKVTH